MMNLWLCTSNMEAFDELEEAYLEMEEQVTALIASYVDDHLELLQK